MNKKEILEIITKEIENWDPIKLIEMGAPKNEYEIEIKMIVSKMMNNFKINEMTDIIYEVFIEMFDESTFNNIDDFKNECKNASRNIFSKLYYNSP